MFEKIKSGLNKSVTTVNVTSSVYLETSKRKVMIENDESAIRELTEKLGKTVFEQWENGIFDQELIGEIAAEMQFKKQEIQRLRDEILNLENEKQMILGAKEAAASENASAVSASRSGFCQKCGTEYKAGDVFCGSCGNRIGE